MPSAIPRRSLLNYIGIAILLAGMACGEFIYWRGLRNGDVSRAGADSLVQLADSRAYDRAVETQVGVFGRITSQVDRALGEPGPLALTIIAASLLTAGGCFILAARMPRG